MASCSLKLSQRYNTRPILRVTVTVLFCTVLGDREAMSGRDGSPMISACDSGAEGAIR